MTYNDILLEILTISGYPDNKEKFVTRFEELNYEEALGNTIEKLSLEVQEAIRACNNDPEKIKQYIPSDLYFKELIKVSSTALTQFLESISSILSLDQKERIAQLILAEERAPSLPLQA